MSLNIKLKSLLAPVAAAVVTALAPTVASADAVAQAYLNITNFGISADQAFSVLAFTDSGDVSASINGGAPAAGGFNGQGGFTLNKSVGPDAVSYTPLIALTGAPSQNYVGSYSFLNGGDPLAGTVQAAVDNTVSLHPGGTGTAQSNVNLTATFLLSVASNNTVFSLDFDADAFLRTMLDPFGASGSANAKYDWDITVRNFATGAEVFYWAPDGSLSGNITGGTETVDDFDLSQASGINFGGADFQFTDNGSFAAKTNPFATGVYALTINHKSNADADLNVPEPSALALAGLALLAVGFVSRGRRRV